VSARERMRRHPGFMQLGIIRSRVGRPAALRESLASIERALQGVRDEVLGTREELAVLRTRADRLETLLDGMAVARADDRQRRSEKWAKLLEILRFINADEPEQRRRLRSARLTEGYELAYSDPNPLISVVIPTYDNYRHLGERAVPSVLAQTHQNLELVIVGDQAPPQAEQVALSFNDPRIVYRNLPMRGRYPERPVSQWLVAGSLPANEAFAMARGRWIAPMADDDEMRPNHLAVLLERARRDRLELVYGRFEAHVPDAEPLVLGEFPPALGQVTLQAGLQHAELRFFELELADALFELPSDWAKVERMLRVGVRCGMVDEVVVDIYPSRYWGRGPAPTAESSSS
jgi:Glycosyl transferase family 2